MNKFLLVLACICLPLLASAALMNKVPIKDASANSYQDGQNASRAIDGDRGTLWHSSYGNTSFPVTFTITLDTDTKVDMVRYTPRTDNNRNGNWMEVTVSYAQGRGTRFTEYGTYNLEGSGNAHDFWFGDNGIEATKIRFTIKSGANNFASASEIEAFVIDNTKRDAFREVFSDEMFTKLRDGITGSQGIDDPDVSRLVDNILSQGDSYMKFRVGEYEPYRDYSSLQREMKTSATYSRYENPTGVYLKPGEKCLVMVSGIADDPVGLTIRNWVKNEAESRYSLSNGLNMVEATTEGNVFVNYFTDNYKSAPNVKVHFINAPVRGFWQKGRMTNADWVKMLEPFEDNDSSIIMVSSEHAMVAYPVFAWKKHCPTDVDSLMSLYQKVQDAERYMMGWNKYGRQQKNHQLFFATTYGFMAAGGNGAYCHVNSLGAIMTPDARNFDFWGVGHEWGHNNQINGFKWSGCGETTNNIYASWAQIMNVPGPKRLRLEDETSGVDSYSGMRGGRFQTYFEEGLRKGVQWQLQDGPDYHGVTPASKTVNNYDYDGNYLGTVTTTSRNYDHFVKLSPFWQMNLWGTLAGKCPDIIPMVIESIRNNPDYNSTFNTAGKQQVNFMKLACDSARLDLLPFFEKAGMLKPIEAFIEDYGAGWIKISEKMINDLKEHVAAMGYAPVTEEVNYITGHNYQIYRDKLKLAVPESMGQGCEANGNTVTVRHSEVRNAVAFETYNAADELIRITMYGLGSDDNHTFTRVLYPASTDENEAGAYIVAVGYDGTRTKIYDKSNLIKGLDEGKYYTITSVGKGGVLSCGTSTTADASGAINWNVARHSGSGALDQIWTVVKHDGKPYLFNPQSGHYLPGTRDEVFTSLATADNASGWEIVCVDEALKKYTIRSTAIGRYLNAHNATNTGYWGAGADDANSCWIIEEVTDITVNIPASGYYTVCYPVAVELPSDIRAYAVGEVATLKHGDTDYSYAILNEIKSSVIPAGMPVVLNGSAGRHAINITAQPATAINMTNLLKGSTLKLTGLTAGDGITSVSATTEAGAQAVMKATSGTTVGANRGYMLASDHDGAKALYLRIDGNGSSGITGIESDKADVTLYDLNGVRVTNPLPGRVYVTSSGKKILVK